MPTKRTCMDYDREIAELRLRRDRRLVRARVARAVEQLRETFDLRPGCNSIEDAAEDACMQFRSLQAEYEGYREAAQKSPKEES